MNWFDITGLVTWVAAYLLAVYLVGGIAKSPWWFVFPPVGMVVGIYCYLMTAFFGEWAILIVGLAWCASMAAIVRRVRARRRGSA